MSGVADAGGNAGLICRHVSGALAVRPAALLTMQDGAFFEIHDVCLSISIHRAEDGGYTLQTEEGTFLYRTYHMESVSDERRDEILKKQIAAAKRYAAMTPPTEIDPRIEALVTDLIGRVADKWTMLILEVLAEKGTLRFSRIAEAVDGISQKMLTQTLRAMERDGLISRTVFPVIPPRVEYRLTDIGFTLGAAFCGVWIWAGENLARIERARAAFDAQKKASRSDQ